MLEIKNSERLVKRVSLGVLRVRDSVSGELALWLETVNVCHFYNMSFFLLYRKRQQQITTGGPLH